jgi:tetratricopeptide (TPR) repeat protein
LILTQGPSLAEDVQVARGGQALRQALVRRDRTGLLPLGPETPGIWALARSVPPSTKAGDVAARQAVEQALQRSLPFLDGTAQRLAGIALGSLDKTQAAQQALDQALQSDGQDVFAALALGNVLDQAGQRDAARSWWDRADATEALSFQLYRHGSALAGRGQDEQAEAMLLLATEIDPANADAFHALGGLYWGQDQEKAVTMYGAALALGGLDPLFVDLAEGRIALAETRWEDAVASFQHALELRPDHAEAARMLATALEALGRLREATDVLNTAAERSPQSFWPLVQVGQIYLDQGQYSAAVDALAEAVSRQSNQAVGFALLARAYAGAGELDRAVNAWQQAIDLAPDNENYYLRLGDAWLDAGDPDQAIAAYRQALQRAPDNEYALRQLEKLGAQPASTP